MMAENPSFWWSLSGKPPTLVSQQPSSTTFLPSSSLAAPLPPPSSSNNFIPPQYLFGSSPVVLPQCSLLGHHDHYHQDDHFPLSWSHFMSGLASDEEVRGGGTSTSSNRHDQLIEFKKLENWEGQILNNPSRLQPIRPAPVHVQVKQETDQSCRQLIYNNTSGDDDELQASTSSWSTHPIPWADGSSCGTSTPNVLDFSTNKRDIHQHSHIDSSSECNGTSTSTGGPAAAKKARVQPSSTQPGPLKVRKEKLGDRITALHQMVSPFGKTDTASVLLEAIGFIRFLEAQIEALTSPYLANASATSALMQHYPVKAEMRCINAQEPGQDEAKDTTTDLRSRGLCLVPVSCTDHIDLGSNNGSDYWPPALGGGGGRGGGF